MRSELSPGSEASGAGGGSRPTSSSVSTWFNPGFLRAARGSTGTRPADAAGEDHRATRRCTRSSAWDDLRRRLDRRPPVLRLLPPALPKEPLIFVEVALLQRPGRRGRSRCSTRTRPAARSEAAPMPRSSIRSPIARTGLRGISLRQFPDQAGGRGTAPRRTAATLSAFATLSPMPGFRRSAPPPTGRRQARTPERAAPRSRRAVRPRRVRGRWSPLWRQRSPRRSLAPREAALRRCCCGAPVRATTPIRPNAGTVGRSTGSPVPSRQWRPDRTAELARRRLGRVMRSPRA